MVSHRRLKSTPSDLISPSLQQPNLARSSAIHTPLVDFSPASHRSSWPTSPCICRPPSCRSRSSPVSLHEVGIPPSCLTTADLHHPSYVQLLIELLAPYKYYTIGGRRIVPYLTPADRSYNISRIHGQEHEQAAPFTRRVSRLTDFYVTPSWRWKECGSGGFACLHCGTNVVPHVVRAGGPLPVAPRRSPASCYPLSACPSSF